MNYIELDSYSRKWIFTHASMPVEATDLEQIKPFTQARSSQIWREHISTQSRMPIILRRETGLMSNKSGLNRLIGNKPGIATTLTFHQS